MWHCSQRRKNRVTVQIFRGLLVWHWDSSWLKHSFCLLFLYPWTAADNFSTSVIKNRCLSFKMKFLLHRLFLKIVIKIRKKVLQELRRRKTAIFEKWDGINVHKTHPFLHRWFLVVQQHSLLEIFKKRWSKYIHICIWTRCSFIYNTIVESYMWLVWNYEEFYYTTFLLNSDHFYRWPETSSKYWIAF